MNERPMIAYFSMEIGVESTMPTYSGGLGVLAGDSIRSAADLGLPLVAVTLLHRKGYFRQRLDASGWQTEEPDTWTIDKYLREMPSRASVSIEGRTVLLRAWRYEVTGTGGHAVPVYFLDADLPENTPWDRTLTDSLYGGDPHYRLCQEVILGMGGVRMLRALGHQQLSRFHLNEGHAALLTLELLDEAATHAGRRSISREDIESVREKCVFTTHTPVSAGHDQFPLELVVQILGQRDDFVDLRDIFSADLVSRILQHPEHFPDPEAVRHSGRFLNMTYLALNLSRYVNGVAKRHADVSRHMFAGYEIDAITNGVHAATWTAEPLQELYDRYVSGWRADNFSLRFTLSIPKHELWRAHEQAKSLLIDRVNRVTGADMSVDHFTLGFARRATAYKRPDLLLTDVERLKRIASQTGPIQVIYAGKAHPRDQGGKELIHRLVQAREALGDAVKIAYLENYDIELGRMMTSGVDVWLNTPQPPLEASGTSGMKAALNGVPSLSVLDGWWIEGHIEGVTGWSIGHRGSYAGSKDEGNRSEHASSLYEKLELVILPLYYRDRDRFLDVMHHAIALNGSFFNTQRMMQQYALKAYAP
ncbi:MAG: alpha-glucan family phosphorylase [Phycisphaerae bacterium]|nr:alpha-glucan family phosphorylase [Phycisphaerae bacterium]